MEAAPALDITGLLHAWQAGDQHALAKLVELVSLDLRRSAHRYMLNERKSHTLQTTALVNEAYLRLIDIRRIQFQDRVHFLAVCANQMRKVLIDAARCRNAKKRSGGHIQVSLDSAPELAAAGNPDLLDIDGALNRLAAIDKRKAKVVELRFFGGLTEEEVATALEISVDTVCNDWKFAKAWLRKDLAKGKHHGS